MAYATVPKEITKELKAIRKDLNYIKIHITSLHSEISSYNSQMVDADTILTPEEEIQLEESLKEHKEGKTTFLEDFEKEMK